MQLIEPRSRRKSTKEKEKGVYMTSINTTSLQQFSSLFNRYSSNSISDEYRKSLYLAQLARKDREENTRNSVEGVVDSSEEKQHVSQIFHEVTATQPAEHTTPETRANASALKTNYSENNQKHDDTINQLKVRRNSLQQELARLKQKGNNQAGSPNQEGGRGTTQEVDANNSAANKLTTKETPLAAMLKRQIDEIEKEINKNSKKTAIGEDFKLPDGPDLSQLRQQKIRLEQQLRNMEDKASEIRSLGQDNTRNNIRKLVKEGEDSPYQNQMEELRIKQKIRNLESEIEMLARKNVTDKIQVALNETRNLPNETTTEGHLLDIEV